MTPRTNRIQPASARRGTAIIVALVSLSIAMVLSVSLVKLGPMERRKLRSQEIELQVSLLAESGLRRAVAQLGANAAYEGETWILPAEELGRGSAAVLIRVQEVEGQPNRRRIHVRADFPQDELYRSRTTRELTLDLPITGEAP